MSKSAESHYPSQNLPHSSGSESSGVQPTPETVVVKEAAKHTFADMNDRLMSALEAMVEMKKASSSETSSRLDQIQDFMTAIEELKTKDFSAQLDSERLVHKRDKLMKIPLKCADDGRKPPMAIVLETAATRYTSGKSIYSAKQLKNIRAGTVKIERAKSV